MAPPELRSITLKLGQLMGTGGPMMVHCASGNRVGALFALKHLKWTENQPKMP